MSNQDQADRDRRADLGRRQARKFQRELSAGLTSLVLLSVLADADDGPVRLRDRQTARIPKKMPAPFKQGALYPVLRNMSAAGLLSSRVVPSYSGPPAPLLPHHAARAARCSPSWRDDLARHARFRRHGRPPTPAPGDTSHDGRDAAHRRAIPRLLRD